MKNHSYIRPFLHGKVVQCRETFKLFRQYGLPLFLENRLETHYIHKLFSKLKIAVNEYLEINLKNGYSHNVYKSHTRVKDRTFHYFGNNPLPCLAVIACDENKNDSHRRRRSFNDMQLCNTRNGSLTQHGHNR